MLLGDSLIYILKQESLPHFINAAEWNLAPAVSVSPPINFVMYVPAKKMRPLYLLQSDGMVSITNTQDVYLQRIPF